MDRSFCRRPLKLPAKMQLQNALPTIVGLHNIIQCALHVEILKVSGSLWLAVIYCDVAHATIHFGDNYPPPDPMIAPSDRTTTFLLFSSPCSRASQPTSHARQGQEELKYGHESFLRLLGVVREKGEPASQSVSQRVPPSTVSMSHCVPMYSIRIEMEMQSNHFLATCTRYCVRRRRTG